MRISPTHSDLCTWCISFVGGICGVFCNCLVMFPCPKALTLKNIMQWRRKMNFSRGALLTEGKPV